MLRVYKITGCNTGGKCYCGHHHKRGSAYWLVEKRVGSYTFCEECGRRKGFRGQEVTAEFMARKWFGELDVKETLSKGAWVPSVKVKVEKSIPVEAVSV